jgi:multidrug efflux pump subunit AcrB
VNDLFGRIPVIGPMLPKMQVNGRTVPQWEIEKQIFADVAGIPDVRVLKLNDRGERDVVYNFTSPSTEDLDKAAAILETKLRLEPALEIVGAEGALPRSEIQIYPDLTRMARLGITTSQVSDLLRVATIGDVDTSLPKVSLDDRMIPIRVELDMSVRRKLDQIKALEVPTARGGMVPLSSIATVAYSEGPSTIKRESRNRVVAIGASLPKGVALETAQNRYKAVFKDAKAQLPPSVQMLESGDAKVQGEMQRSFINAMILGILLVFAVLVLLFKDIIQPITVILSLPLSIGGVAIALLATGTMNSMPVMIGMLMLMGIVTKNAILLVDFAVEMRHHGFSRVEAMVEAGRKRARPIIMTSIAMSAGMLPSALGVGEGGSFRSPMAIAVTGGIIMSTVSSLVAVPSFSLVLDDLSWLLSKLFGWMIGKKEAEIVPLKDEEISEFVDGAGRKISSLEERLSMLENASAVAGDVRGPAKRGRTTTAANDIEGKPQAAE